MKKNFLNLITEKVHISHRLYYITIASVVLYLVAASIGWLGLEAASASLKSVYEDRANPMRDLATIDANIREDSLKLIFAFEYAPGQPAAGLMTESIASLTSEVRNNEKRFKELWQRYQSIHHEAKEKALAAAFVAKNQAWMTKVDQTASEIEAGKFNAGLLVNFLYAVQEERQAVLDALRELINYQANAAKEEYKAAEQRYRTSRYLLIGFLVFGAMIVGGPAFLTLRYINKSLKEAGQTASAIASGDLTGNGSNYRQDEIGELMQKLSSMRESLRDLIGAIRTNTEGLSQQAAALSDAAESSAQTVDSQSAASAAVASAINDLSQSLNYIDQNAQEAHTISQTSSRHADEGGQIIFRTTEEMERIAHAVNLGSASIGELEDLSRQISSIVQVIKEIADQTNLLALNAAIEAARAGEHGRGFAVVADEVKKLAERTSTSTHEIGNMIDQIQLGTQSAVTQMADSVSSVNNGVALAKEAGQSVTEIRDAAQRTANVVAEITKVLMEQNESSKDVAQKVDTIAQGIESNSVSVAKTAEAARQLADLSSELARLAGHFRID